MILNRVSKINPLKRLREEIARRLHIDAPSFQSKLRMKNLVDIFLSWKGIKGEYDYEKLDDAEQDFMELEKETRKSKYKNDPALLDQAQKAVFIIIDEKPREGRSYSWIRDLFRNFDQVYSRIKQKEEAKNPPITPPAKKGETLLDTLAGEESGSGQIVNVFNGSTPEDIKEQSVLIQETIKDIKAETSEKKDAEAIYKSVSNALREMQGLSIDKNTTKIEEIYNKLEELIKISSGLLKKAKKFKKV